MTRVNRWLLPDGVDEILPPQASKLETLRRDILDLYSTWGYELVITPLIEFIDSLMVVPSTELQLQTFKIIDQLTGRTMGVRADITSQVARIDAHVLQSDAPTRLCYADSVLRTKPSSMLGSRSPIRIGAELYGHSGTASDIEVISLMLETLAIAGVENVQLALGHVGIYRSLIEGAGLDDELKEKLFDALQRKSEKEIESLFDSADTDSNTNSERLQMLIKLPQLSGDETVLDEAETILKNAPGSALQDIQQLRTITQALKTRYPTQSFYFDLSELRGYEYHTGVVFAAYVSNFGQSIAKGGRYDHIGADFGRARAATGFDSDLKTLLALSGKHFILKEKVFAPGSNDPELLAFISQLRSEGKMVICSLEGQTESAKDMDCHSEIIKIKGKWCLQAV
ncbi:ATP phosphoribosyltransferase regulatory subunit [Gammaproteobacteria bacterium]|nr:ATP phosphoribosyltransferase regulatory subunit [Gammaproteobacteria bacterium]